RKKVHFIQMGNQSKNTDSTPSVEQSLTKLATTERENAVRFLADVWQYRGWRVLTAHPDERFDFLAFRGRQNPDQPFEGQLIAFQQVPTNT
ncbi:MAG: hypothetical protein ABEI52_06560, partial [Halobacteriaceae archaeon]